MVPTSSCISATSHRFAPNFVRRYILFIWGLPRPKISHVGNSRWLRASSWIVFFDHISVSNEHYLRRVWRADWYWSYYRHRCPKSQFLRDSRWRHPPSWIWFSDLFSVVNESIFLKFGSHRDIAIRQYYSQNHAIRKIHDAGDFDKIWHTDTEWNAGDDQKVKIEVRIIIPICRLQDRYHVPQNVFLIFICYLYILPVYVCCFSPFWPWMTLNTHFV